MIDEPGHYQVFNTTILESGFYLQLKEQDEVLMKYDDLAALYEYVHNRTIEELSYARVIDQHMRLFVDPARLPGILYRRFKIQEEPPKSIADALYQIAVKYEGIVFSDWTKIYPGSIMTLPFIDIANTLQSDVPWLKRMRPQIPARSSRLDIQMSWLAKDATKTDIYYDTSTGYYLCQTDFVNRYGNQVSLVIASNTERFSRILNKLSSAARTAEELRIIVGKTPRLASEHKLLCTTIVDPTRKQISLD